MKYLRLNMLWVALLGCASVGFSQNTSWNTTGNTNLNQNCFIGTTDQNPVSIKAGGNEQMKIAADGSVTVSSLAGQGSAYVTVGADGKLLRTTDPGLDSLFDCSVKLWKANGNFITPDCFIGSTNKQPFRIFTHNSERLRVTELGSVGIGTVNPKGMLQIGDYMPIAFSVRTNGPADTRYMLGFNTYLDGTTARFSSNGPAAFINWDAVYEDICIGATSPGAAGQQANIPVGLAVGSDGNVGIGTRNQLAALHIFRSNAAADLRLESGDPLADPKIEFWAGPFGNAGAARLGMIQTTYNQNNGHSELKFSVNAGLNQVGMAQVFSLDESNAHMTTRLGIGSAPNPNDQITVNGAARITQAGDAGNFVRIRHDGTDAIIEHQTTTANNNAINRLVINPNGSRTEFGGDVVMHTNIGIGTDEFLDTGNGKTYRLSVDGRIRAREVKVYSGWADHVFEPDYDLMPLSDVAAYIEANGHLPGMPSAAEVDANGIDVGETQALLLEKIEELTLHLIRLEEENERLKAGIAQLKK